MLFGFKGNRPLSFGALCSLKFLLGWCLTKLALHFILSISEDSGNSLEHTACTAKIDPWDCNTDIELQNDLKGWFLDEVVNITLQSIDLRKPCSSVKQFGNSVQVWPNLIVGCIWPHKKKTIAARDQPPREDYTRESPSLTKTL